MSLRSLPDLGDVIPIASGDGPAVWKAVGRHSAPNHVELDLEHVETGEVVRRVMLVVSSEVEPTAPSEP